jgi:hypothetical protein
VPTRSSERARSSSGSRSGARSASRRAGRSSSADGQPVAEAIAAALAPFDMGQDADGRWDSWRIGVVGRYGPLPVRTGSEGDSRILRVSEPPEWWSSGRCDGAPRGLLDFTRDRAAARYWAEAEWDEWHEVERHHPVGRPVSEFEFQDRAAFADQPVMRAYMEPRGLDPQRMVWQRFSDPMTVCGYDRENYVRRQVARTAPVDELLRLDGAGSITPTSAPACPTTPRRTGTTAPQTRTSTSCPATRTSYGFTSRRTGCSAFGGTGGGRSGGRGCRT